MFKNLKRGNYYVVPKAIARLKQKFVDEGHKREYLFDAVFVTYILDFQKRYDDKGDEKAYEALQYMIYLEIDNYLMLALAVLYVDVAPKGTKFEDNMDFVGKDGCQDLIDTFLELGFSISDIDGEESLLSNRVIDGLKKRQQ